MKLPTLLLLLISVSSSAITQTMKTITKSEMEVSWQVVDDHLQIEMSAPTTGWVAIGFNTRAQLTGTSLFMGRVHQGKSEVVDFYVRAPGDYEPVTALGGTSVVQDVNGEEKESYTLVSFRIPLCPKSTFHQQLRKGETYHLLLAYSREDDFRHHSIMRTSVTIQL